MASVATHPQPSRGLRTLARTGMAAALLAGLAGCVVAPVGPGYHTPRGVVYVAPTYVSPGPGFVWIHHSRHGWGWHHPRRGWHRGWR